MRRDIGRSRDDSSAQRLPARSPERALESSISHAVLARAIGNRATGFLLQRCRPADGRSAIRLSFQDELDEEQELAEKERLTFRPKAKPAPARSEPARRDEPARKETKTRSRSPSPRARPDTSSSPAPSSYASRPSSDTRSARRDEPQTSHPQESFDRPRLTRRDPPRWLDKGVQIFNAGQFGTRNQDCALAAISTAKGKKLPGLRDLPTSENITAWAQRSMPHYLTQDSREEPPLSKATMEDLLELRPPRRAYVSTRAQSGAGWHAYCVFALEDGRVVAWDPDADVGGWVSFDPRGTVDPEMIFISL